MGIGQLIDTIQEGKNLTIVLKETDNRLVKARQFLIWLITSWVVGTAAVKHIAATITTLVLRNALSIRKAEHTYHQRTLCIIFRERGRAILWMLLIWVLIRRLIAIGTGDGGLNLLETRHLRQLTQDIGQIRIGEIAFV